MIWTRQYEDVVFENLGEAFKATNIDFYQYITNIGLELDLSKKDQQKIYLHHFIIYICNRLKCHNEKIVFHINTFEICDIHVKMIKKIKQIFGIRIWESPYSLETFMDKLHNNEVEVKDPFEMWLHVDNKPKSFRHIKKYLDKEGFTFLSDTHFKDLTNKIAILC
jgi:hypothetical protein